MSINNKLVTLSSDGTTATVADASLSDIITTAVSTTENVTGLYALAQRGLLFAAGMAVQNKRVVGSFNIF